MSDLSHAASLSAPEALSYQQQELLTNHLLRISVHRELNQLLSSCKPLGDTDQQSNSTFSLISLPNFPFIQFLFNTFVFEFPWLKTADIQFWLNVNKLLSIVIQRGMTNFHRESGAELMLQMAQHCVALSVLPLKNLIKPEDQPPELETTASQRQVEELMTTTPTATIGLTSPSSVASRNQPADFQMEIIAAREMTDNSQQFTGYVIETTIGHKFARTVKRYTDFEALHNAVITPPSPLPVDQPTTFQQEIIISTIL